MAFEDLKSKLVALGWAEEEASLWALWETNPDIYDSDDYGTERVKRF